MSETKLMALREAVNLAMSEEMRKDPDIFLMGEDVGIYGGDFGTSVGMLAEFGEKRVKDTPISEAAIAGAAVGAAITGLRPIVDLTFMDFITIALDAIVNNGAKNNYMFGGGLKTPVTFRVASGSGIGSAAQHSQSLESWLTHIPGIKVVAPGNANDAKGLLKSSIQDNNIVIFMEPKALYGKKEEVTQDPDFYIPLGKGEIKREGTDLTIVTYGRMLERVLKAAEEVAEQGINVEVVDPRTLVPLDKELIFESVKKTGKLMLVNDAYKTGGFIGEMLLWLLKVKHLITLTTQLYVWQVKMCLYLMRVSWNKRFFQMLKRLRLLLSRWLIKETNYLATVK